MSHGFTERALRSAWEHGRFDARDLRTTNGVPVFVISPGTPNDDAGPDFRDATIRVGRTTFHGDVEMHLRASSWKSHRHTNDPRYNRVILHVVLSAPRPRDTALTSSKRTIPCLALEPYLIDQRNGAIPEVIRPDSRSCGNQPVHVTSLTALLEARGLERLEAKRSQCEARFHQIVAEFGPRQDGDRRVWRQLFFEKILEGMGFSKNREAFLRLARVVRLVDLEEVGLNDVHRVMAVLFTAAGLLPSIRSVHDPESGRYIRLLKTLSRNLPPEFRAAHLHETDWLFFRLRPPNFPTARLAMLSFLLPELFREETPDQIFRTFRIGGTILRDLAPLFQCETDTFWQRHVHFMSAGRGIAFGQSRMRDLVVNALMPVSLAYADLSHDRDLRDRIIEAFLKFPALQENAVTREVRSRLDPEKKVKPRAALQQGMLMVHAEWCGRSDCAKGDIF